MNKITTTGNKFLDIHLDFDCQVITGTGILLVLDKDLTGYAKRKQLDVLVYLVVEDVGPVNYLIVDGQTPLYESAAREDIAVHLDMMAVVEGK